MESKEPDMPPPSDTAAQDINMYHYLEVLARWKRFLLINTLVVALVVAGISLLMPNEYRSTASILPPKQESGMGGALSQLTKDFLPTNMLGKLGVNQSSYNYLAILNSRIAKDSVIRKFNLTQVYGISSGSLERARGELEDKCSFEIGDNGDITVSVLDTDPGRAANIANYLVDILNSISIQLSTREARNNRLFLEQRYIQAKADMRMTEDSMRAFQDRHGIYALPEQTKAAIEEAAQLRAQASIAEVELGILERSLGKDNSQTRLKQSEIQELNDKLREMKFGTSSPGARELELFVPFKDVPELGMQYLRLYRELEIQTKIMQLVIPMYEQSKVEEQKTVPVVLVLDAAVAAEKKDRPKRTLIVLSAILMMLFLSMLLVFLMETIHARHQPGSTIERAVRNGVLRVARWYRVHL